MRKIKLVYVVSTLGRTGPTRQLYNLIRHLDRERFQAEVITMSPNPPGNLEQDFLDLGITVHTLALARLAGVFFGRSCASTPQLGNRFVAFVRAGGRAGDRSVLGGPGCPGNLDSSVAAFSFPFSSLTLDFACTN